MNKFKIGDVVVANCNCGSCLLHNWLGTIESKYGQYDSDLMIEFTENWYDDNDTLYFDSIDEDDRMSVRHATEQEKLMYIAYGSRGLEIE